MSVDSSTSLAVESTAIDPAGISAALGLTPDFEVVMGEPIGSSERKFPYHKVFFHSRLAPQQPLHEHLSDLLDMIAPLRPKLDELRDRCSIAIHCDVAFDDEGSWVLAPGLLHQLAELQVDLMFSLQGEA